MITQIKRNTHLISKEKAIKILNYELNEHIPELRNMFKDSNVYYNAVEIGIKFVLNNINKPKQKFLKLITDKTKNVENDDNLSFEYSEGLIRGLLRGKEIIGMLK